MSKLITAILLTVLIFGVAVFIFQGDKGLKEKVGTGYGRVSDTVRSFDYVSN
ncbi:MAG: hypothetical protein H7X86_02010 [Gorillibacterium sp.]|nr:hypothetical protein [Gorillibacterium sp.]